MMAIIGGKNDIRGRLWWSRRMHGSFRTRRLWWNLTNTVKSVLLPALFRTSSLVYLNSSL